MSDIRFNQWLHNSGTGGVSQVDGGHVGIGTTNPLIPVGAGVTAVLNVGVVTANSYYGSGANLTGIVGSATSLSFNDNIGAYWGNAQDLKIHHDGNHSYIDDQGTGNLRLRSGTLEITNLASNKTSALFSSGGGQTLNFNNSAKFATTNTGVVVTGIVTSTSRLSVGNNTTNAVDLEFGTNRGSAGQTLANINWKWNNTYVAQIRGMAGSDTTNKDDAHLTFYTAASGSLVERLRITSDGKCVVGNNSGNGYNTLLQVHASGDTLFALNSTSGGAKIKFYESGTGRFNLETLNGSGGLMFYDATNAAERLRIAADGRITQSGKTAAAANPAIDPYTSFLLNDSEARLQLCATNSGSNAAAIILSNESKHFVIHQRGPVQSNNFEIAYQDIASPTDMCATATPYLRVTTDGYSKHTSGGGFDSYVRAIQAHEFRQYQNSSTLWTSCTNTSQTWEVIRADSARSGTNAMNMITTTTGNLGDDQHRLIGNGDILCDGTAGAGAADYAEYFEWTDSNSSNEDRRGMTVVLVDGKVRKTTSSDSADNIIGVVSANPVVVGDAQWRHWQSKYLRDDYGNYIYEDHNQITWTDDNGVKHDYEDWNVPSDVTVPNVGVTTTTHDENGIKLQHQKLNPSYDASKTYIPRSERKEWDAIGMVGKLRIRKGQITGTRWIKMKDISVTVEEWLVR